MTIDQLQDFLDENPFEACLLEGYSTRDKIKFAVAFQQRALAIKTLQVRTSFLVKKNRRRMADWARERHEHYKEWLRKNT